jgi:HEPN domain-containing protein
MTNRERADQLLAEGVAIAVEMRQALEGRRWNLAVRRAQEVVELVTNALLNEMGVDYPREHDAAPILVEALRVRGLETDPPLLEWVRGLSRRLARLRGPVFYHEVEVSEPDAREVVADVERVLGFAQDMLGRLRGKP